MRFLSKAQWCRRVGWNEAQGKVGARMKAQPLCGPRTPWWHPGEGSARDRRGGQWSAGAADPAPRQPARAASAQAGANTSAAKRSRVVGCTTAGAAPTDSSAVVDSQCASAAIFAAALADMPCARSCTWPSAGSDCTQGSAGRPTARPAPRRLPASSRGAAHAAPARPAARATAVHRRRAVGLAEFDVWCVASPDYLSARCLHRAGAGQAEAGARGRAG